MVQATLNLQELQAKQQLGQRLFDGTATPEEVEADRAEHAAAAAATGTEALRIKAAAAGSRQAAAVAAGSGSGSSSSLGKTNARKAVDDQTDDEVMSRNGGKWTCLDKSDDKDVPVEE